MRAQLGLVRVVKYCIVAFSPQSEELLVCESLETNELQFESSQLCLVKVSCYDSIYSLHQVV